jgi:hypothetical protein
MKIKKTSLKICESNESSCFFNVFSKSGGELSFSETCNVDLEDDCWGFLVEVPPELDKIDGVILITPRLVKMSEGRLYSFSNIF